MDRKLTHDQKLDAVLNHFRDVFLNDKDAISVEYRAHEFLPTIGISYNDDTEYDKILITLEDKLLIKKTRGGYVLTDKGRLFKGFESESLDDLEESEIKKIHNENIRLTNNELEYKEKIRSLEEQLLAINLVKSHWDLALSLVAVGAAISAVILKLI